MASVNSDGPHRRTTKIDHEPRLGAILQIPLPNGRFAYCRVFRDASIGVYASTSDHPNIPPSPDSPFRFVVGVMAAHVRRLEEVGYQLFADEADEWPPPYSVRDDITGTYEVYHRGEIISVPRGVQASELEPAAVWTIEQIVERIGHL